MALTNRTNLGQHNYNELYGQVIGLFGDPTNQDIAADGTTQATTYANISWSASDLQKALFWSRVLLCLIFNPFDSHYKRGKIALVLKPRSLWLFQKSGQIADFAGNVAPVNSIGTADADGLITSVNPPYVFGDYIRIGTLGTSLDIASWSDGFTGLYHEYYDQQTTQQKDLTLAVSGMTINASTFVPTIPNFAASKIVYYDKNVDARTRIVGGDSGGADIIVPLCIGGVSGVYKLKGVRIS